MFRRSLHLTSGRTYILWDCKLDKLLRRLRQFLDSDYKCVLFTRHNPRFIKNHHENLEIVWVSEEKCGNSLPPVREHIMRKFNDFLMAHPVDSIVVFDVFDYLATPEDEKFDSTLNMFRTIIDRTAMTNNILIVEISSKSFDETQRSHIERSGVEEMML